MALNSKKKGAAGELELAHWLNDNLGLNARRGVQYQGIAGSADIVETAIPNIYWECKRTQRLNVEAAMAKAAQDSDGKIPVVAHRRNRSDWLITVQGRDLKTLALLIANHVKAQDNAQ